LRFEVFYNSVPSVLREEKFKDFLFIVACVGGSSLGCEMGGEGFFDRFLGCASLRSK